MPPGTAFLEFIFKPAFAREYQKYKANGCKKYQSKVKPMV
jgi:hypothetical protein